MLRSKIIILFTVSIIESTKAAWMVLSPEIKDGNRIFEDLVKCLIGEMVGCRIEIYIRYRQVGISTVDWQKWVLIVQ